MQRHLKINPACGDGALLTHTHTLTVAAKEKKEVKKCLRNYLPKNHHPLDSIYRLFWSVDRAGLDRTMYKNATRRIGKSLHNFELSFAPGAPMFQPLSMWARLDIEGVGSLCYPSHEVTFALILRILRKTFLFSPQPSWTNVHTRGNIPIRCCKKMLARIVKYCWIEIVTELYNLHRFAF